LRQHNRVSLKTFVLGFRGFKKAEAPETEERGKLHRPNV
jgi:hypothetical protein